MENDARKMDIRFHLRNDWPEPAKDDWPAPVQVTIAPDAAAAGLTEDLALNFTAFRDWSRTLRKNLSLQASKSGHTFSQDPWTLDRINIHAATFFGPRVGFMQIEAKLRRDNEEPRRLERVVFLRGGSVAMLMILRPRDSRNERYVIMTEQPRVGAGSMCFLEIPAGMLDDSPEVRGKVLEEIKEETGFAIQKDELIDLTELALRDDVTPDDVRAAMYPSPANLDEFIPLFVWEKELDRQEIEELKGKLTGLRKHQEMITLVICHYEEIWRKGARDAKTLAAWALYEGLSREGKIQKELLRIRTGRIE
ncbi:nudix family hydrolase [Diplodia corticola]|uniref:Nudix family hydrolase n=1 Tax=Diplodia corticola TaxID=236234 RepID=A0A1J9R3K8_9PEZI|nr:nudix family hydrolase [Diplodia corticola]OJD36022.1 nudix family hydrolase [Diplodia corticola]